MIPTPRPGPRHGDCPDCGRQHDGDCHLAEMERNREVIEPCRDRRRVIVMWSDRPLAAMPDDEAEEAHKERMQARGPITDADSALTAELLLRRSSREPRESMSPSHLPFRSDAEDDGR